MTVVPSASLALEKAGDFVEGPSHLRAKISDVYRIADGCGTQMSRIASPFRSIRMPRENELGFYFH